MMCPLGAPVGAQHVFDSLDSPIGGESFYCVLHTALGMELSIVFLALTIISGVLATAFNQSEDIELKRLSRKKRFLLFPPGANILLTSSFGKGLVFRGPAGYVAIGELDLYYPLPDYKYHASALKLGKIAMYPPEPKKAKPPPPPPPPTKAPVKEEHHHHDGGELTPEEVKQYLKDHPDTYVPPGWGKDRADWNTNNLQYQSGYWAQDRVQNPYPYASNTLNHYLGTKDDLTPGYYGWTERPYDRYRRSLLKQTVDDEDAEEHERSKWLSGESFNISQHSSWEHFHHYRDRRALFNHLEESIGS
uniref:Uncharacterized protein n=1 Tax=Anopheles maculatus TaxID=74869 RepID=A0A182SEK9_9DIPT